MSADGHERWLEDAAAYSLGALGPAEATEFEDHLAGCERCRERLRWLAPAVAALPESVERQPPPQAVRERLMAEVRADARAAGAAKPRRGWLARLGGGRHGWKPAVAVAALALVLVAFAGYEIGSIGSGGDGRALSEVSQEEPSGITAKVITDGSAATLKLEGVRSLPADRVLEAWVQRDGAVEAVPALFVPDDEGRASTVIEDMDGVEAVMVTREPQGGSETPTSDPIVMVEVE